MAPKCSVTFAAVAVVILAVAMVMGPTDAAISKPESVPLTSWSGPGCSGTSATVDSCGCSDLQFYDGQEFEGQTATFYTETGCAGTPYQVIGSSEFRGDFGWRSINIDC
ncbi:unnamed protein product [Urochloa humidicola]